MLETMLHQYGLGDLGCWILLGAMCTWTGCASAPDEQAAAHERSSDPSEVRTDPAASSTVPSSAVDPAPSPPPLETATPCAGRTGVPGDQTFSLTSGGVARDYALHVPDSYDPTLPTMLVISFHGFSSDSTQQAAVSGMSAVSDERGFIAVYPNGLNHAWNGGTCCPGAATDDVQFVRDMVAQISESYCVDPRRIFTTGISNGGLMANRVACEAADLIASTAPVAAGLGVSCQPSGPRAHLAFAGTLDPFVPYAIQTLQSETWRSLNGCSDAAGIVYQQGDATCEEWSACRDNATVRLCTIDGGGHTWPGGVPIPFGKTSIDIDATREMVAFFEGHPMP